MHSNSSLICDDCDQTVMSHAARCAVVRFHVITSPVSVLTSEFGATATQIVMTPATRSSAKQVVTSLGQRSIGLTYTNVMQRVFV